MAVEASAGGGRDARQTFHAFSARPIEAYIRAVAQQGALWFFQHIPKTAGSTLGDELRLSFAPYRNVFAAHAPGSDGVERQERMEEVVERFLVEHAQRNFRSASGHLRLVHVRRVREALPHARIFTFLRNPVDRVISEYRYTRTPKHPDHERVRERYPSIEAYVDDPGNCNRMWSFVAPRALQPDENGLKNVLSRYAFIGTVEKFNLCWEFLTGLNGFPKTPGSRRNVTQSTSENSVEVTSELRARIAVLNAQDMAFFEAVSARLGAREREMQEFVDERRSVFLNLPVDAARNAMRPLPENRGVRVVALE